MSEHNYINPEYAVNSSQKNKVSFQVIRGISNIECKKTPSSKDYTCIDKRMNSFSTSNFLEQVITNSLRVQLLGDNTSKPYEKSIIGQRYGNAVFHHDVIDTVFKYYESNEQKNISLNGEYEFFIRGVELYDSYASENYIFDINENTKEANVINRNYRGGDSCDGTYDMITKGNLAALVFNPSKSNTVCKLQPSPLFLFQVDSSNQLKIKSDSIIYGDGNWFTFNNDKKAIHSIDEANIYYDIPIY